MINASISAGRTVWMHKLRWIVKYQSCIFLKNSQKGTFLNINHLSKLLIYEIWSFYNPKKSPFWYFFSQMAYFSFSTDPLAVEKLHIVLYLSFSSKSIIVSGKIPITHIQRSWLDINEKKSLIFKETKNGYRPHTYVYEETVYSLFTRRFVFLESTSWSEQIKKAARNCSFCKVFRFNSYKKLLLTRSKNFKINCCTLMQHLWA